MGARYCFQSIPFACRRSNNLCEARSDIVPWIKTWF
jgi:hypothetical protein